MLKDEIACLKKLFEIVYKNLEFYLPKPKVCFSHTLYENLILICGLFRAADNTAMLIG